MAWFRRSHDREQIRPLVELTGRFVLGEIDAAVIRHPIPGAAGLIGYRVELSAHP